MERRGLPVFSSAEETGSVSTSYPPRAIRKASQVARWTLQGLLASAFLAAAAAKLVGAPMMLETFERIGFGQWFRFTTAAVEIVGAVALLTPRLPALGGALLAVTMACAILAHLITLSTSPAPAAVLMVLCLLVVWLRRAELPAWPRCP
jgi:uncharacterized membrane protein YphA (DoxX/SURF4 family)